MKTRKLSITICTSLLIVGLLGGCKGPQGEVGPQGETGATGAQGPVGAANVVYSGWISPSWRESGDSYVTSTIQMMRTDEFDSSKDILLVYAREYINIKGGTNFGWVIFPIPGSPYNLAGGQISDTTHNLGYAMNAFSGRYYLYVTGARDKKTAAGYSSENVQVKWVYIKGGTPYGGRKAAIDYSDYEAVKKAYNLPD